MVAMDGGKGVGMAGGPGDIREGIAPPFREVSNRNPVDAVKLLLEAGAIPMPRRRTATRRCISLRSPASSTSCAALVEGGADMNVKDAAGKTALQVVSEQKPRPPRPTAGALVDGEMPAQPPRSPTLLREPRERQRAGEQREGAGDRAEVDLRRRRCGVVAGAAQPIS